MTELDQTMSNDPGPTDIDPDLGVAPEPLPKSVGVFRRAARQFRRDRVAMAALIWLGIVGTIAVISLFWTPHPPNRQFIDDPFLNPFSGGPLLGTDDLGRDITSRMMVGAWVSIRVSLIVVSAALVLAIPVGLFAGYRGGYADTAIMRILDTITSVPGIVAAMTIVGVLGPGLDNLMIALVIFISPGFIRLIRAQALAVTAESYVAASRSVGSRTWWILLMRVLPGVLPALCVVVSLSLGGVLTAEAALSFLGLGVLPPDASWGGVLSRAYRNVLPDPAGLVAPIVGIGTVVLAFNLVGDGIRDSLGAGFSRASRKKARLGLTVVRRDDNAAESSSPSSPPDLDARLSVRDLCVEFETEHGSLQALDHVSFDVRPGEVLGIVGESGSGKTVTAMSIMRLLNSPPGVVTNGTAHFDGVDLFGLSMPEMRKIRGSEISMVFQNPMTSLDPVFTIGHSLREAINNHQRLPRKAADARAVELLDMVGIPAPANRLGDYPHNFSGGMRQRVMLAVALAGEPSLVIADEPTTALDVTIQAQMLDLLKDLQSELDMSMVLVTHDLGVVAEICDRVAVMYAGHIVETAPVEDLFASPKHPYTAGLLSAVPSAARAQQRLASLPGSVPQLTQLPPGCRFAPRCPHVVDDCVAAVPPSEIVDGRQVRCIRAAELELEGQSS